MIRIPTLVALLVLSGCATGRVYYNPYIDDPVFLNRQFTIDDGYCTSAAVGAVPIPQIRIYTAAPQSYSFSGQMTTYNPATGYSTTEYRGTVQPTPSAGDAFATGFANGMNMGAAIAARNNRDRVYHACMVALGWTDKQGEVAYLRSAFEARRQALTTTTNTTTATAPSLSSLDSIDLETQGAIDSIPELRSWQRAEDRAKWDLAVTIDKKFVLMPRYANVSVEERLIDVVKEAKAQTRTRK